MNTTRRPDAFGQLTAPDTVRIERLLPGPIERVWAYLTDSDKRSQWLSAGDIDLQPGGRVDHLFHNNQLTPDDGGPPPEFAHHGGPQRMTGSVTVCEPPHRLSYLWNAASPDPSEVSFELTPQGQQVLLVVTHARLPDRQNLLKVSAGWHAHLDLLRARLEGTPPAGFWPNIRRLSAEYDRRLPA